VLTEDLAMRNYTRTLVTVVGLATIPLGSPAAQAIDPPVTTGGMLSSKPWLHTERQPARALPVVTGRLLPSKPWLLNVQGRATESLQPVTRGRLVSSKPWIHARENSWVHTGPVKPVSER
jgi:hypothetical protein